MPCPSCGTLVAEGAKFCHRCGTAVATGPRSCPHCGKPAGADFRYCPHCRTDLMPRPATGGVAGLKAGFPWFVGGAAVATVALLTVWRISTQSGGPQGPDAAPAGMPRAVTDISQMSPEERALRLFNRVMRYAEQGQQDSMGLFLPMALSAYGQVPALDADARYHLGLLDLLAGNAAAALAQADSIRRSASAHLFTFILRAQAYRQTGDQAGLARAYRDYLANFAAERARQRPEYGDHAPTLDAFADTARAAVGPSAPPRS